MGVLKKNITAFSSLLIGSETFQKKDLKKFAIYQSKAYICNRILG